MKGNMLYVMPLFVFAVSCIYIFGSLPDVFTEIQKTLLYVGLFMVIGLTLIGSMKSWR